MLNDRACGILLHPTSLPSRFGIGDLGQTAYDFIDFLNDSFQRIWQILPLGPTGYGNSPYQCYSAFAGNPLLISPDKLKEEGLLEEADFEGLPNFSPDLVEFDQVVEFKSILFQKAFANFYEKASQVQRGEFRGFCQAQKKWLEDYALFMAIKDAHQGASWHTWDKAIAQRQPEALKQYEQDLEQGILYHQFLQFQFFRQWYRLKEYASHRRVSIFGDLPIYVSHDSADVWANPEIFCLDQKTLAASTMAGVPPDYFSADGQLWGNPVYLWKKLEEQNFSWWLHRLEFMLSYNDVIRIDHFRGFEGFWGVRPGADTAKQGKWLKAPGEKLFKLLEQKLGYLPIVAEDLGVITPEVEQLRDQFNFPGMKILQFAFDSDRNNPFLPFNYYNRNCVVYTGTHDNDTTMGWFNKRSPDEQQRVIDYLGCVCPEGIHWGMIRLALSSVANIAIIPLQDVLGLGTEYRMNIPSTAEGNWLWRYQSDLLTEELKHQLRHVTQLYGRAPH